MTKRTPIGPQTYSPKIDELKKGIKIGDSKRHEERGTFILSPAPNRYNLLGDFDFKDPSNI